MEQDPEKYASLKRVLDDPSPPSPATRNPNKPIGQAGDLLHRGSGGAAVDGMAAKTRVPEQSMGSSRRSSPGPSAFPE